MFSVVGLFLGLKSKIFTGTKWYLFQILILYTPTKFQASRFNNMKKIAKSVDPLKYSVPSIFETQGRKHGRNLSWSWTIHSEGGLRRLHTTVKCW